ncbi:MAG: Nif11 family protein [Coriobacteriia bacterium]|nr:Nif11 family protein [Coriobacteriia bacterium]
MKDVKQFIQDLQEDKDLATAFEALAPELEEKFAQAEDAAAAKVEAVVAFAKERGYEVDPEELAVAMATNREVDDDALAAVAGGGRGWCMADYGCYWVWNSCQFDNECKSGFNCKDKSR